MNLIGRIMRHKVFGSGPVTQQDEQSLTVDFPSGSKKLIYDKNTFTKFLTAEDSKLQEFYKQCFEEKFGYQPTVEAIHAGLECGVLSAKIPGLDAISIGPELSDVHTTGEKLKIYSAKEMFELICELLSKMK